MLRSSPADYDKKSANLLLDSLSCLFFIVGFFCFYGETCSYNLGKLLISGISKFKATRLDLFFMCLMQPRWALTYIS
jgi:hypothetical protein